MLGVAGQAGRWSERYDLINHITPLILLSSLAAIGLSLALGRGCARWLGVTIGAVADLTAGLQIVPVLARSALQSLDAVRIAKDAPRLKLIQLSVFHANPDPHATVDWLLSQNADVIVLEESKGLDPKSRARLVAAYP